MTLSKILFGLCLPFVFAATTHAQATNYPDKRVSLIVPYSPGGGSDNVSRATARFLSSHWGQTVIVENLPGADGLIGANRAIKSPADGYTLLVSIPAIAILKHTNKAVQRDPLLDLTPVSMLATGPTAIVVKAGKGIDTIDDFKRVCGQKSANCSWASGEPFTLLAGSGLMAGMGLQDKVMNVRYSGTSAAVNDVIGEHVTALVTGTSSVLQQHKAGVLKILAVSTEQRIDSLPNVPTYAESGLGEVQFTNNWYGIFAPAGTPEDVKKTIADGFRLAAQDPDVLKTLTPLLLTPVGSTPESFAEQLRKDQETVDRLAKTIVTE